MSALVRQWFLLALAVVLAIGFLASSRLAGVADAASLRDGIVALVLFLMALPLETGTMWQAVWRPWPTSLAVLLNVGLLPLIAWAVSPVLGGELGIGLVVAAAAPCTLASAAVWTRRAGGNDAVAIMVTVITNLFCFVVTPLWLVAATGRADVQIDLGPMIVKLGYLVVAPMVVGQLVRQHGAIGRWATRHKSGCGTAAQCGILLIVLMGAIKCGLRLSASDWQDQVGVGHLVLMVLIVLVVHLLVLALGHGAAMAAGMDRQDRIAVGFAGSQKTLMVGLHVALTYFGGLTILPMVAYHVGQLLVDTVIADFLRARSDRFE
jgi:sodium/bile acid cotransporter 7